jgi:hypothetical protein
MAPWAFASNPNPTPPRLFVVFVAQETPNLENTITQELRDALSQEQLTQDLECELPRDRILCPSRANQYRLVR